MNWVKKNKVLVIFLVFAVFVGIGITSNSPKAPELRGSSDVASSVSKPTPKKSTGKGVVTTFDNKLPPVYTGQSNTPKKPYTTFSDGTYEVGVDIVPGKYKSDGSEHCYYARLSGFDATRDVITNEFSAGPKVVDILSTDKAFKSMNCSVWTLVS
jgi:hypothetical protein